MDKSVFSLELTIAKLLRVGVIIAGLLIFAGWMSRFDFVRNPLAEFGTFHDEPLIPILRRAWDMRDWGLLTMYAGLISLIALPFTRVLMTAVLFVRQREYILAAFAALVVAGLLFSFSLGFVE